jgi:hypothetical protein
VFHARFSPAASNTSSNHEWVLPQHRGRSDFSLLAKRWMRQGKTAIVAQSVPSACNTLTIGSKQSAPLYE